MQMARAGRRGECNVVDIFTASVGNNAKYLPTSAQIERDCSYKIAELQRAHEVRVEAAKAARDEWKKDLKRAAQAKVVSMEEYRSKIASEPVMPPAAADPGPFIAPRLYVSNVTIERLAVLLQARPQGMLLLADELSALFLNMSRYSGGQDNEFWLEAWNGDSYTVERMGRPPIVVDHLLIGIVGGMQPDKLARSFKGEDTKTARRTQKAARRDSAN